MTGVSGMPTSLNPSLRWGPFTCGFGPEVEKWAKRRGLPDKRRWHRDTVE
jgi:hypothetical protein